MWADDNHQAHQFGVSDKGNLIRSFRLKKAAGRVASFRRPSTMSMADEKALSDAASSDENIITVKGTQGGVRRIEAIQSASRARSPSNRVLPLA